MKITPHPETKETVESLRSTGQAIIDVANALEGLDREASVRVLRAVAILHQCDLTAVGLQEIPVIPGGARGPDLRGSRRGTSESPCEVGASPPSGGALARERA